MPSICKCTRTSSYDGSGQNLYRTDADGSAVWIIKKDRRVESLFVAVFQSAAVWRLRARARQLTIPPPESNYGNVCNQYTESSSLSKNMSGPLKWRSDARRE